MSRQFTWWRRFHTTLKLNPKHFWKGHSKLLQRIEFGEFEYDHLGYEVYLEEAIFESQIDNIKETLSRSHIDTINEKIRDVRIKKNKRRDIILEKHFVNEFNLLNKLKISLAEEFDMTFEFVEEVMETFDGTTRHLFFHLMAIKYDRKPLTAEDLQMIPRAIKAQPRHVLKYSEGSLKPMWDKIVKDRKIWQTQ